MAEICNYQIKISNPDKQPEGTSQLSESAHVWAHGRWWERVQAGVQPSTSRHQLRSAIPEPAPHSSRSTQAFHVRPSRPPDHRRLPLPISRGPRARARPQAGGQPSTSGPASETQERHAITFAPATAKRLIFNGLIISLRGDMIC